MTESLCTYYYGMTDNSGNFITMPFVCNKTDNYAAIYFKQKDKIGEFASYINGDSFCDLTQAMDKARDLILNGKYEGVAVYRLSKNRPKNSTEVDRFT